MGIFGTSKDEESQLRQVHQTSIPRPSSDTNRLSVSASSNYETADEGSRISVDQQSANEQNPAPEIYSISDDNNTIHDLTPTATRHTIKSHKSVTQEEIDIENRLASESLSRQTSAVNAQYFEDPHELEETPEEKEELGVHPNELTWDGPDDKDNPKNWPNWKKWYVTFTSAIVCLCVSLGSSLYMSGVFDLSKKTGSSLLLCSSGLTFYLLGLAFGPAIAAPISETFGRKIVYCSSFPVSMLFVMGIGLSNHIYQILILRFFCGFLASPALAIAGGTINDVWSVEEAGVAMALFCLAPFLGPVLGPIVGGFAAEHKGWKWTMWVSLMFCGAILPFVLLMPETYKPVLLVKKAKRKGVKLHLPSTKDVVRVTVFITLLRPLEMLIVEPIVLLWSFYIAFVFAVLFGFFEAFPIIFRGTYHMQLDIAGLTFIGVGIGLFLGVFSYIIYDRFSVFKKNPDGTRGPRDEKGNLIIAKPEEGLVIGQVGAIALPIGLFWLAWTSRKSVHWAAPAAAGIPFGFGLILVFFANMRYFTMTFPPMSLASALGANNLLRYLLASVFPLFTTQMYQKLHIGWATSIFGFISVVMIPIPFLFQKYGASLRTRSKFGYYALMKAQQEKAAAAEKAQQEADEEKETKNLDTNIDHSETLSNSSGNQAVSEDSFKGKPSPEYVANKV